MACKIVDSEVNPGGRVCMTHGRRDTWPSVLIPADCGLWQPSWQPSGQPKPRAPDLQAEVERLTALLGVANDLKAEAIAAAVEARAGLEKAHVAYAELEETLTINSMGLFGAHMARERAEAALREVARNSTDAWARKFARAALLPPSQGEARGISDRCGSCPDSAPCLARGQCIQYVVMVPFAPENVQAKRAVLKAMIAGGAKPKKETPDGT